MVKWNNFEFQTGDRVLVHDETVIIDYFSEDEINGTIEISKIGWSRIPKHWIIRNFTQEEREREFNEEFLNYIKK